MTLIVESLSPKDIQRIFSKISFDETNCWNWHGEKVGDYGRIRYKGRKESIHRLIYAWLVSPLSRNNGKGLLELDHVFCNNKSCCNPDHMKLVSHKDNVLRTPNHPTSINAKKTHCIHGHLLPSQPNDLKQTKRYCKICLSEWGKIYHKFRCSCHQHKNG